MRKWLIGAAMLALLATAKSAATPAKPAARVTTGYIDAKISLDYPGFEGLSVDSLGKEHFPLVRMGPPPKPWQRLEIERKGSRVEYRGPNADSAGPPRWAIQVETNEILLESHWSANDPPRPLTLNVDNKICHVTLLGLMNSDGSVRLPAILHFPGQGSFRISADPSRPGHESLGYAVGKGDMFLKQAKTVKITFPGASREHPAVNYLCRVVAIHPKVPGIAANPRFDAFRRDWLNIFQLSPRWHTLANHAASDTCAFCYYEYADLAERTPPLAKGLNALDMVRQTLDNIMAGTNAYGMPARSRIHQFSADTRPSLLIAAHDYIEGDQDYPWLAKHYPQLKSWADTMLATDRNGDGLIKYALSGNSGSWPPRFVLRPANWWDTIGFGYEDAYANALAYRALRGMEQLARQANHPGDSARYEKAADKLKAAYFNTFYDPATGVLAGWRSADGQLHDYYFPWVNGIAIHYDLVPKDKADAIMDRLLAKMKQVGYTNFALGLPGNLIPVARKDYVNLNPRWGGGTNADNSDGFQMFENGGATACFAYFTVAALYDLGRIHEADQILFPILKSIDRGDFQGRDPHGAPREWKKWDGTGCGYEGFLTDNYYVLLAVLDREAALKRKGAESTGIPSQSTRETSHLQK